jgi:predicted XRE-type DNA-binding protein
MATLQPRVERLRAKRCRQFPALAMLTLLFRIEMHMGQYRTDENIRFS